MKHLLAPMVATIALAACDRSGARHAPSGGLVEIPLAGVPPGLSDLTRDATGRLWAIPERDHEVVEIALDAAGSAATSWLHPLDGVPDGVDTEAIAWLGGDRFALGTEGQHTPTASVLFAERRGDRFAVTGSRDLASIDLGVKLVDNHGAEAICGHDDEVIVGIEERGKASDGTRWAPLVWLHGDRADVVHLGLTTATGKISALACTFGADDTVDALAIERHYGVTRVLRFRLRPGARDVVPELVRDLLPDLHAPLNLEGIARLADGRWALVNDNQTRAIDGPSMLLVIPPR